VPSQHGPQGPVPPQYGPQGAVPPPPAEPGTKPAKSGLGKRIASIGMALVIGLGIFGVKSWFNRDQTADAKVGDCINAGTVTEKEEKAKAKMADCGSPEAGYSVVGRVENDTSLESKACDKYFTEAKVEYAVYASDAGNGYLLCLKKA
jgi:hypothetical protein